MTDEILLRFLKRPSRRRLADVVRAYHEFVWKVAFQITRNSEDAADICQEVFLKLLLEPPAPERISSERGYLAWCAIARAGRARRASERRKAREMEAVRRAGENSLKTEDFEDLYEAVAGLPEDLRAAIELHYMADLEDREIAGIFGIAERTVRDRLQRAREALKEKLSGKGIASVLVAGSRWPSPPTPPELLPGLLKIAEMGSSLSPLTGSCWIGVAIMSKKTAFALVALLLLLLVGWSGWIVTRSDPFGRKKVPNPSAVAGKVGEARNPLKEGINAPVKVARLTVEESPQDSITKAARPPDESDGKKVEREKTAEESEKTDQRMVIVGHITDPSGKPIQDVSVRWAEIEAHEGKEAEARTDREGAYRLEVPAAGPAYQLIAVKPGWAPSWERNIVPGTAEEPAVVDFELGKGGRLEGTVVDASRAPVEGAEVIANTPGSRVHSSFLMPLRPLPLPGDRYRAITSQDGTFAIDDLPGDKVHLKVEKDGFTGHSGDYEVGQEIEITLLRRDGVLRGRIVDAETGAPVVSFEIRRYDRSWPFSTIDGRFEIEGQSPGARFSFEIIAEGYALGKHACSARKPDDAAEDEIRLERGSPFRAMVIDGRTGTPLPNAPILAGILSPRAGFDWGESEGYYTGRGPLGGVHRLETDEAGRLEIRETDAKSTLFILAPGLERMILRPEDRPPASPDGLARIELHREASISGSWVSASRPDGGTARLWKKIEPGELEVTLEKTPIDDSGCFRWGSLHPGSYQVSVPGLTRRLVVQAGQEARIVLGPDLGPHTIHGRAMPWAEIFFTPEFEWDYCEFQAKADGTGFFQVAGLKKGRYAVRILTESYGVGRYFGRRSSKIEVTGDGEHDLTGR